MAFRTRILATAALVLFAFVSCDEARRLIEHDTTLLHYAAEEGDAELAAAVLQNGAALETRDGDGKTALAVAAEHGSAEVVSLLVDAGADHRVAISDGRSLLHWAAERGEVAIVELLLALDAGYIAALPEPTEAPDAAETPDADPADGDPEAGAETASVETETTADPFGNRPLIQTVDAEGYTPVDRAAQYGRREVVLYLVNAGAPVDRLWPRRLTIGGVILD